MIPVSTLYDEYIDRPKLTEQKNPFEYVVPPHTFGSEQILIFIRDGCFRYIIAGVAIILLLRKRRYSNYSHSIIEWNGLQNFSSSLELLN